MKALNSPMQRPMLPEGSSIKETTEQEKGTFCRKGSLDYIRAVARKRELPATKQEGTLGP